MGKNAAAPGFFEKRDLLYAGEPDASALSARGREFLEAGLLDVALELFARAGNAEGLAEVDAAAFRAGDAFSFEAARKALGKTASAEEWVAVGERAFEAGLLWFAYRSFEKADHQEGLERTRREMFHAGITPESR